MRMSWGIFSKYKLELYGTAILWIMLLHGLVRVAPASLDKSFSFLTQIIKHGYFGVEIFLFLSGICLFFSMNKNDDISEFYKKRIIRIIVPYFLITGSYWFGTCVIWKHDILRFIGNITQFTFWFGNVHFAWFIGAILVLYLIYPLIYHLFLKDKSNRYSLISILLSCITMYIICFALDHGPFILREWFKETEIALTRFPVFFLGCYFGKLVYENKEISPNWLLSTFLGGVVGVFYLFNNFPVVSLYRLPGFIFSPCFALWIVIIFDIIHHKYFNRIFQFLGERSLELYLTHLALQNIAGYMKIFGPSKTHNYHLYLVYCVIGGIIVASLAAMISNGIIERIKRKLRLNS